MREPTYRDVAYGPHERNVVDAYLAESESPAPVFVYIHGGGFRQGDKGRVSPVLLEDCLEAGISVVSINYRLSGTDPYPTAMEDGARAVQFVRYKAEAWNLDSSRVAAGGGSAGAGISFWIGFREDSADPESQDPVARQSTRLTCISSCQAQSSYDMNYIRTIISGPAYAHQALQDFFRVTPEEFETERAKRMFKEASGLTYVSREAPPVFIWYATPNVPMSPEPDAGVGIHHPIFGLVLKEKMDALGVECVVRLREDLPAELSEEEVRERFHHEQAAFVKRHFGVEG